MSNQHRGLGRGLDALMGGSTEPVSPTTPQTPISEVHIHQIEPNPHQPRRSFDAEGLEELAASIKSQGIIQPIVVRPTEQPQQFEIIAGERRWRAAKMAGLDKVPVFIRSMDDDTMMLAALIENLQREDLNPLEEALALKELRDTFNLTQDEIAQKIGKARTSVANTLRLLSLSLNAQEDLKHGRITAGHARCLLAITELDAQEDLRAHLTAQRMSVREAEDAVNAWKTGQGFPWATPGTPTEHRVQPHKPSRSASPALKKMQKQLSEQLGCKSCLSGTTEQGKLTINYTNTAQLLAVLQKLGMEIDNIPEE